MSDTMDVSSPPESPLPDSPSPSAPVKKRRMAVEKKYKKPTQREHVLLRPDTYVGSIKECEERMLVLIPATALAPAYLSYRPIMYVPGLYKIFDEILVNAADNTHNEDGCTTEIKATIDAETGTISVWNNGASLPAVMHRGEKAYVPEMVFGTLLAGSNFDDDQKKLTGGRNGYGAKLTNIFSTSFTVETNDVENNILYRQTWTDNMSEAGRGKPKLLKCKRKTPYTCVTFTPDYPKFGLTGLSKDHVALFSKRVYDMAGTLGRVKGVGGKPGKQVRVSLNGERLPITSFVDYINMIEGVGEDAECGDIEAPAGKVEEDATDADGDVSMTGTATKKKKNPHILYYRLNRRFEVAIAPSDGFPAHVSFVNNISTDRGGTHVDVVRRAVAGHIKKALAKGISGVSVPINRINDHMFVFVNALVENPAFSSQTKRALNTFPSTFGCNVTLPKTFLDKCAKSKIATYVRQWERARASVTLARAGGKKTRRVSGIPKLDDANWAGTAKSMKCTLILTEGDSAKTLAVSGLSVVGRDAFGVFPLRGKMLNVRGTDIKKVSANQEVMNVCKIMGLRCGVDQDVSSLRYGHILIMADQDKDGSHIKGLVLNMLHHFWPSLCAIPDFVQQFITPIVKVKKAGRGGETLSFYTMPDYEEWCDTADITRWGKPKYFKGLGTSTAAEAREYFSDMDRHRIAFDHGSAAEANTVMNLAFNKKCADKRKQWLARFEHGTRMDYATGVPVTYRTFVDKELILFSMEDNERSIPSMVDGMKPSQRKILFACLKRNLTSDLKVAQLAGYIGEQTAYHHGEVSLQGAIVGMAQTFTGSNNVALLFPSGQFGTRLMGGKDSASPRYIFTKLQPITRLVFRAEDDPLLTWQEEEGLSIEPEHYLPVIPMLLWNGASGIGTGYSTDVPCFKPEDVVAAVRSRLTGNSHTPLVPWYRGFRGTVRHEGARAHLCGTYVLDGNKLTVTELPVGRWVQDYKTMLEDDLMAVARYASSLKKQKLKGDKKGKKSQKRGRDSGGESATAGILVKDFKENHTEIRVHFTITLTPFGVRVLNTDDAKIRSVFKLDTSVSMTNMHAFNEKHQLVKYASVDSILSSFIAYRLPFYKARKDHMLKGLRATIPVLTDKMRFLRGILSKTITIAGRKKAAIEVQLTEMEFGQDEGGGFNYLLKMPLWNLTEERVAKLEAELAAVVAELDALLARTPMSMWMSDLDDIDTELVNVAAAWDAEEAASSAGSASQGGKKGKGKSKATKKAKKTKASMA